MNTLLVTRIDLYVGFVAVLLVQAAGTTLLLFGQLSAARSRRRPRRTRRARPVQPPKP